MQSRNEYIFQNLHVTSIEEDGDNNNDEEVSDDDSSAEEDESITRDMQEQEELDGENDDSSDEEEEDDLFEEEEAKKWYLKVEPFLNHVNEVSQKYCLNPGFCVSIDKQMKKFKGRSSQTVRMKNKPIKEGFKFFALCDATTGFVYAFKPSGRLEENKITAMVIALTKSLPDCDKKKCC